MSANLDTTNGVTSFVSARLDAWHRLGEVADHAMTAEEALKLGRLAGWQLRKEQLYTRVGGLELPIEDRFAVVRNNPVVEGQVDVLGVVKDRYSILQNEEMTELLDALVEESEAHYETAGALDGGRRVFVTMKVPSSIKVGGVDPVDLYLAMVTSHDGSTATTLMTTPTRIVCQNTLNVAMGTATGMVKVRHTSGASAFIRREARKALELTFDYMDEFQAEAERLINTELSDATFNEILKNEFGAAKDAHPATATRAQNKIETITELFQEAYTQDGIRNTAWAGFNALTEYYDHFSPVKVKASGKDEDVARGTNAIFDASFKTRALELMLAV